MRIGAMCEFSPRLTSQRRRRVRAPRPSALFLHEKPALRSSLEGEAGFREWDRTRRLIRGIERVVRITRGTYYPASFAAVEHGR